MQIRDFQRLWDFVLHEYPNVPLISADSFLCFCKNIQEGSTLPASLRTCSKLQLSPCCNISQLQSFSRCPPGARLPSAAFSSRQQFRNRKELSAAQSAAWSGLVSVCKPAKPKVLEDDPQACRWCDVPSNLLAWNIWCTSLIPTAAVVA